MEQSIRGNFWWLQSGSAHGTRFDGPPNWCGRNGCIDWVQFFDHPWYQIYWAHLDWSRSCRSNISLVKGSNGQYLVSEECIVYVQMQFLCNSKEWHRRTSTQLGAVHPVWYLTMFCFRIGKIAYVKNRQTGLDWRGGWGTMTRDVIIVIKIIGVSSTIRCCDWVYTVTIPVKMNRVGRIYIWVGVQEWSISSAPGGGEELSWKLGESTRSRASNSLGCLDRQKPWMIIEPSARQYFPMLQS